MIVTRYFLTYFIPCADSPRAGDWFQVDWAYRLPRKRLRHSSIHFSMARALQVRGGRCHRWRWCRWPWYVFTLVAILSIDRHRMVCRNCWRSSRRIPCKRTFKPFCVGRNNADALSQEKKITIVHAGDKLLNDTYTDKFRNVMASKINARDIDLLLGEYAEKFPPSGSGELVLRSGKKINAGLVVSNLFACIPLDRRPLIIYISQLGCLFWSGPEYRNDRRISWPRRGHRAKIR